MIKLRLSKKVIFNIFLVLMAFIITLICSFSENLISDKIELKVGSVSPQKYIAEEEIKNEIATQRNIDKAVSEVSTLYTQDESVKKRVLKELDSFFDYLDTNAEILKNKVSENQSTQLQNVESLAKINNNSTQDSDSELSSKIYLSQSQISTLAEMDSNARNELKNNLQGIIEFALDQGIKEDYEDKTLLLINDKISALNLQSDISEISYSIILCIIEPNMIADVTATEKAKEEKAASVEPVMVLKNQKIVDSGEIITEEIYSLLFSAGYIKKDNLSDNIIPIVGETLLIFFIIVLTIYYIYKFHKALWTQKSEKLLLLFVYALVTIATKVLVDASIPYMFIPVLLFTLLIAIFLNYRLAIVLNFCLCIIYYVAFNLSTSFLIYFSMAGMINAFMANYFKDHSKIFKVGLLNSIAETFLMGAVTLYSNKTIDNELLKNLLFAFSNGILTLILCTGITPCLEYMFGVMSYYRLLGLINPDNTLLRKLMLECPGTYNHSIIVANLAEAAAFEIGANSILAKVGSYYHDIGKLKYPQYFSENIRGENPHNSLDPYESAKIISSHVSEGLNYAVEYKLPNVIKDIIEQHHGNTIMGFFYFKAKQTKPENTVNELDFRYKHRKPQTKEAAIVMLADTVEAAIRSKNETDIKEIKKFVHELIKGKLIDGQFNECPLKIRELDKIENAFMGVLNGMYHERVAYPTDKKEEQA